MKDLDDFDKAMEQQFGGISGFMLYMLWETSTAAGSQWDYGNPETMDIIVTAKNADYVYSICKEIRSGYSVGLNKSGMEKVKQARAKAHKFLFEEANNPDTPIDRKIALVKLTSK